MTAAENFAAFYARFKEYPINTKTKETYSNEQLKTLHHRLLGRASELLVPAEKTCVPIREIEANGNLLVTDLLNDDDIKRWLEDGAVAQAPSQDSSNKTKAKSTCRLVFLTTDTPVSPLKISMESLQRLFTYLHVPSIFLDFIHLFGPKANDYIELDATYNHSENFLEGTQPGNAAFELGRTGRKYTISYNLKHVYGSFPDGEGPHYTQWGGEQVVAHHQFDIETGEQTWIFGVPCGSFISRVDELLADDETHIGEVSSVPQSFVFSLKVHSELVNFAADLDYWDDHLDFLEKGIEGLSSAMKASGQAGNASRSPKEFYFEAREWQDKSHLASVMLKTNEVNLEHVCDFYQKIINDGHFPVPEHKPVYRTAVDNFVSFAMQSVREAREWMDRAKAITKKAGDLQAETGYVL